MFYKIEAEGDTMYVEAENEPLALERLFSVTGPIPVSLLTVTPVKKVPKGEQLL